jgi:hypothetical protein
MKDHPRLNWPGGYPEAPIPRKQANRVLLTIEWVLLIYRSFTSLIFVDASFSLTSAVVQEAINSPTFAIISYHPPIFKPLSSLTLSNSIQQSLLLCAANGISVFSPHVFDSIPDLIYTM